MRSEDIVRLLEEMGCRKIRETGSKVQATCPLESDHASGRDESPSFVCFVDEEGESNWSCSYPHGNGYGSGFITDLVYKYAEINNLKCAAGKWGTWGKEEPYQSLSYLLRFIWENDFSSSIGSKSEKTALEKERIAALNFEFSQRKRILGAKHVDVSKLPKVDMSPEPVVDPKFLRMFKPINEEGLEYLKGPKRGLNEETIRAWELKSATYYKEGILRKKVGIPIRNAEGRLVGVSRRSIDPEDPDPKYLHSKGFPKSRYLFGEYKKLVAGSKRALICEGQFDVIRLYQLGYRGAVAIFGASMSEQQAAKIAAMFKTAIILGDGDEAGEEASNLSQGLLSKVGVPSKVVILPDGMDAGDPELSAPQLFEYIGPPDVDTRRGL